MAGTGTGSASSASGGWAKRWREHLIKHGYAVLAQDIEPKALEAVRAIGAETVQTPAEVGKACKFVIVAVGYDDEAAAVVLDQDGLLETMGAGLGDRDVVHLHARARQDARREGARQGRRQCSTRRSAAVSARPTTGTMLTLCGGTDPSVRARQADLQRVLQGLSCLLGDIGAGQFGKAMNNFLLWVNGIALIEAGRLSEANGMDLVKLREALLMSSGASDALKNWENVSFLWALKDMQIISKMADKVGLSMPIAGAIKELVKDGRRIKLSNPPDWTGSRAK